MAGHSVFDQLQPCSFAGILFPVKEITIQGGIREHDHEYPHAPGGALEKLGRKLYVFRIKASFQATFPKYPNLWPRGLATLRNLFEKETTDTLVLPTLGSIRACCINWNIMMAANIRSGEMVDLEFKEDQETAFLTNNLISVSTQTVNTSLDKFNAQAARLPSAGNIFDAITSTVNSVLAFVDTAQAYGNLLAAKIEAASTLLRQADQRLAILNDPINHEMLDALLDLWDSLNKLSEDIQATGGKLFEYTVQRPMSLLEISKALYNGNGTYALELLQLNAIDDPYLVPQSVKIRYYQHTSTA